MKFSGTLPAMTLMLTFTAIAGIAPAQSPAQLLQQGLYAEEMEGDIEAAKTLYQQVIDDKSADRRTEFADQKELVEKVTPLLCNDGKWRVSGYYIK